MQRQRQIRPPKTQAAANSKPESAARGQKKLPKELSFGSYAYPHMEKLRFGGALLQAQLA